MENQLQIFEHEKFGEIRIIMIDDRLWFVAADICRALEIGNTSQALNRLEDDEKMTLSLNDSHSGKRGGAQFMTLINEPGFYRLIFASRKKEALNFQRWVYHEVLPSINATGSYLLHSAETKPVPASPDVEKVVHPRSPTASVYAFFLSNALVKIGHSDNIRERVNGVETRNKLTVKKIHFTADVARSIARFVEWACQKHFSSHRVKGEFFNIDFDEACKVIDSLMKIKTENNDKILKIVNMMNGLSENQIEERTLLKMVANFYADRLFE